MVAGFGIPILDADFTIILCWHSITPTPAGDEAQSLYHNYSSACSNAKGASVIFGLENFINATVDSSSRLTKKFRAVLKTTAKQDMTNVNCKLTTANNQIGRVNSVRYPVCVSGTIKIYTEEVLLLPTKKTGIGRW